MSYSKQNFKDGNILTASELNKMDDAIYALDSSGLGNMQIMSLIDLSSQSVSADFFSDNNRYTDGNGFITTRFINEQTCIANIEVVKKLNTNLSDWNTSTSTSGVSTDGSMSLWNDTDSKIQMALEDMILNSFGYISYEFIASIASVSILGNWNAKYGHITLLTKQSEDNPRPEFNSYILYASPNAVGKLFAASDDVLAVLNIEHTIFTSREH